MCDGAHGAPLIPWPNRLADGAYTFEGTDHQVALTEPDKNNAIHGFLRWRNWTAREYSADRVVMGTVLNPLKGYPFTLDVAVAYRVGEQGLIVRTTATNGGAGTCPYDTDNQRQLPTGTQPTAGTPLDFTAGRSLGNQQLDFPFTDLARDAEGRAWVRLTGPDGRRVELWVDESYPIIELYTGDTLAPDRRRGGWAANP